jgi:hypothetical protein
MKKQEIIEKLIINHQKFVSYFMKLNDQEFVFSLNNQKWSPGQHADHILRSLSPVRGLFSLPKWMGKLAFKKANRPSKSYEKLVERYHQRLELGGRAFGRFLPKTVRVENKSALGNKIEKTVKKLCRSVNKYSEDDLDKLILPHPLLGKVTLREMLFFTIYHVDHHHRIAIRDLAKRTEV